MVAVGSEALLPRVERKEGKPEGWFSRKSQRNKVEVFPELKHELRNSFSKPCLSHSHWPERPLPGRQSCYKPDLSFAVLELRLSWNNGEQTELEKRQ